MAFAIIKAMTLKVDKFGRIILPKPVRDRLNLREGAELHLVENEGGFTLTLIGRKPSMILKNGVWVHFGRLPSEAKWETLVDEAREERIRELAKL